MGILDPMNRSQLRTEVLSGLTIAIALVPEAISFALIVGAAPQLGLWAAVFMATSTAVFGGRPGLISGATGATAVIMAGLVSTHGMELLPLGVFVAGGIQLLTWATGAWKVFNRVPKAAVSGFLVALALMILFSQFKYLEVGSPSKTESGLALLVVALSAAAMYLSSKRFKIPPALVAIAIGCVIGIPLGLSTVGDLSPVSASLPSIACPEINISLLLKVLPYSLGMAVAGLVESLLTVDSVSHKLNLHGDKGKETFAQGIGNTISGLFSTIGGCVLVGQTNLNISAGAKHRLSAIVAALGLVAIILFLAPLIEAIPLAGLIGVMLIVVYETGDWTSLTTRSALNLTVVLSTILVSLWSHNLALGVLVGSLLFYLSKAFSRNVKG
jgi:SulP family sulfate permease